MSELKRRWTIAYIAYRQVIRKILLKTVLVLNMFLFIIALLNNAPAFVLYLINMHFLYKYMIEQYPEEKLKGKDRFKVD